nr:hypothetical protein [uncultured bacterium]
MYGSCASQMERSVVLASVGLIVRIKVAIESHPSLAISVSE